MTKTPFSFEVAEIAAPRLGVVALQSDETIEGDIRRLLPMDVECMITRVRSDLEVSSETLAKMEEHLTGAVSLFPEGVKFDAIGYGCTSGTAQIGADQVAAKIKTGTSTRHVTQPLNSLIAACRHLGVTRLAVLSPYVAQVSEQLHNVLSDAGIETPVFGSFEATTEATVVRITQDSIEAAAEQLMRGAEVDALFLSCTNLRALDAIAPLEKRFGKPVLSSNQVLAWHLMQLAGIDPPDSALGCLFQS